MAQPLKLPNYLIEDINLEVARTNPKSLSPTSAISWLLNAGALISKWLPDFIKALQALQTLTTEPTLAEFAAKLNELFNPVVVPAPVVPAPVKG
jgi:hypothetical protein